jgi:fructose-specific phosphotransferase system IIB component
MAKKYIVGVTSCIVGIAHTYMAADALKQAIEKAGCEAKIETQGADGAENEITAEDIARADAAIIAADLKIKGLDRFEPVPYISCKTEEVIKHADDVVNELLEAIG